MAGGAGGKGGGDRVSGSGGTVARSRSIQNSNSVRVSSNEIGKAIAGLNGAIVATIANAIDTGFTILTFKEVATRPEQSPRDRAG